MTLPRRLLAVAGLAAVSSVGLAGCQLFQPNVPTPTASAVEACVGAHEWDLDPSTLASSTVGAMADLGLGVTVTVDGTETLHYTPVVGTLTLDSDLTIVATGDGSTAVATRTLKGTSTGLAFFSEDVAIPRKWDETGLTITDSFTQDGAPVTPAPWTVAHGWLDDTVGLVTTCSDDTLTLEARGTKKSWTFHSPGWAPPAPSDSAAPQG